MRKEEDGEGTGSGGGMGGILQNERNVRDIVKRKVLSVGREGKQRRWREIDRDNLIS